MKRVWEPLTLRINILDIFTLIKGGEAAYTRNNLRRNYYFRLALINLRPIIIYANGLQHLYFSSAAPLCFVRGSRIIFTRLRISGNPCRNRLRFRVGFDIFGTIEERPTRVTLWNITVDRVLSTTEAEIAASFDENVICGHKIEFQPYYTLICKSN